MRFVSPPWRVARSGGELPREDGQMFAEQRHTRVATMVGHNFAWDSDAVAGRCSVPSQARKREISLASELSIKDHEIATLRGVLANKERALHAQRMELDCFYFVIVVAAEFFMLAF